VAKRNHWMQLVVEHSRSITERRSPKLPPRLAAKCAISTFSATDLMSQV
jgi:hypothetical protein